MSLDQTSEEPAMTTTPETVLIFGAGPETPPPEVRRGLGQALKNAAGNASEVAVSTLQENMRRFLTSLDEVMSASPEEIGGMRLEEVQMHLHIDARGNIGISAIADAQLTAQGGIRLVLRRQK